MAYRTAENWVAQYKQRDAYWAHDGNPKRPHALLTSGLHSAGFFNSSSVVEDTLMLMEAAQGLVWKLRDTGLNLDFPDRVIGPAMGAISLASSIAFRISNHRMGSPRVCHASYAEPEGEGDAKRMVFRKGRVLPGEQVLLVEDVITTGGSVTRLSEAVKRGGAHVLPFVAALVNRSGEECVDGNPVVALVEKHLPTWKPEECPLCKAGSEAIRPKGENWARLNGKYGK